MSAGRCGCSSAGASGAAIARSSCVTAGGAGTPASPFTLSPVIDPNPSNLLSCGGSGLLVPNPDVANRWQVYTPIWTAATVSPQIGNGILTGIWRKRANTLEVKIQLVFGTTTIPGTGVYGWSLPAGLVCGFTAPVPIYAFHPNAGLFEIGQAMAVVNGNAIGAGIEGGGAAIGAPGPGYASAYYIAGTVYVT